MTNLAGGPHNAVFVVWESERWCHGHDANPSPLQGKK